MTFYKLTTLIGLLFTMACGHQTQHNVNHRSGGNERASEGGASKGNDVVEGIGQYRGSHNSSSDTEVVVKKEEGADLVVEDSKLLEEDQLPEDEVFVDSEDKVEAMVDYDEFLTLHFDEETKDSAQGDGLALQGQGTKVKAKKRGGARIGVARMFAAMKKSLRLKKFDANKDGKLDANEQEAMKQARAEKRAALQEKYKGMSEDEVREARRAARMERWKKMLANFDADSNGKLSFAEMRNAARTMKKQGKTTDKVVGKAADGKASKGDNGIGESSDKEMSRRDLRRAVEKKKKERRQMGAH